MTGMKTKRVVVDLPVAEHRDLKVKLAKDDQTIAAWLRAVIAKFMKRG